MYTICDFSSMPHTEFALSCETRVGEVNYTVVQYLFRANLGIEVFEFVTVWIFIKFEFNVNHWIRKIIFSRGVSIPEDSLFEFVFTNS